MFDLFRKRADNVVGVVSNSSVPSAVSAADLAQRKQAAIAQLATLANDETTVVDFLLKCEFADVRLQAAQAVQTKTGIERSLEAMRNTDRRVAKLMQARLDVIERQESAARQADQCMQKAQALAADFRLLPNQVSELDKMWEAIYDVSDSAKAAFDAVRIKLTDRLQAQAALQRSVLDALSELRALAAIETQDFLNGAAEKVAAIEARMSSYRTALESSSLPKNLIAECEQTAARLKQSLQSRAQHQEACESRMLKLSEWEASEPTLLKAETLQREWKALPSLPDPAIMAPLQIRFDALLIRTSGALKLRQQASKKPAQGMQQQVTQILEQMELALQEGTLQLAAEHDKALRSLDLKPNSLSANQASRLSRARAELARLQGWAKWGGHVSREELVHAAESLPSQELAPAELAKKIGSLRERWKSLDVSAGPANKDLWQRFDQACSTAYAPAAVHFKRLAEERQQNAVKAQSAIGELKKLSAQIEGEAVDWKSIAVTLDRHRQAWQRLGAMDRKEKKRLDAEFQIAIQSLSEPLNEVRRRESAQREQLIAEATRLDPRDRTTPEILHQLQERWQLRAKTMPLERKEEQALWQRFRDACGKAFAARKDAVHAADAERQGHLKEKLKWCERLETVQNSNETQIRQVLREATGNWDRIGAVPRAVERQTEARYHKAVEQLRKQLDAMGRAKLSAQWDVFCAKLDACRSAEKSLGADAPIQPAVLDRLAADFNSKSVTPAELERILQARFQAAVGAAQSCDQQAIRSAELNRSALMRELLRSEITTGLDSPVEMARERMQLQVEVLQSALKAGQKPQSQEKGIVGFCELVRLSAFADNELQARVDRLIAHCRAQ